MITIPGPNLNTQIIDITPESVRKEAVQVSVDERSAGQKSATPQEDTVSLSSQSSLRQASGNRNKPSLPVSSDEKKSLLNSKKNGHSFSVYG